MSYPRQSSSTTPKVLVAGKDGVDPILHAQVAPTSIDFESTLWTYENCEMVHDNPLTVRTHHRAAGGSFMYASLKLSPGLYVCTVKCSSHVANCRLEIIQRLKDYDGDDSNNWKNVELSRLTRVCSSKQPEGDLQVLVSGDTDAEVRIVFSDDGRAPMRVLVPSFQELQLRFRNRVPMALKTNIPSGYYKPKPIEYSTLDLQRMVKRVHYVINWLSTLDEQINSVLRLASNPLWDMDEPTNAFDYTQAMQGIQNALSTETPNAFVATSCCYSVFLCPGVRIPLISNTLVTELLGCINQGSLDSTALVRTLHHSLKYINFMMVEYAEFKQLITERIATLAAAARPDDGSWNHLRVSC
jgi:hypothetical protein